LIRTGVIYCALLGARTVLSGERGAINYARTKRSPVTSTRPLTG
jgi:hypothetical protein